MEYLPISNYGGQDNPAGLVTFLKDCQKRSIEVGKPQLVNISLDVFHIDPLAVLEAVYESASQHFFLENPGLDESIAAIEQVMQTTAEGPGRFEAIKDWATGLLDQTIFTGNTDSPYCGIHFFCAFNFFDEGQDVTGFPAAQAFVPIWQVSKKDQYSLAIANCMIDADTPVEMIAKKILGAHQRFASFPYQNRGIDSKPTKIEIKLNAEAGGSDSFELSVFKATEAIREGEFEKIVLARALDFKSEENLNPMRFLERLRNRFQSCYTFSYSAGVEGTFLGSTPELLIRVKDGRLRADAIAGSRGRGDSATIDAALGADLLKDDKDAREHQSVVTSITNRLQSLGLEPEVPNRPRLLKLPNVQHLFTPIEASLPKELHILDVIKVLHPTPAVGGTPRERACGKISDYESFVRGPYAGPVGWFDALGDGEFIVGIRSGILRENTLRLFSGAGIVRGSEPKSEKDETDLKFNAMRQTMD
ncbi:MAG: isochorismate synthase [Verrucomicrobia bacterium]|nr:isochorismate synthase [Verrucomicrobiota bacterium]MDA1067568.1 isochorismate synthase [Verrucomicrobiota bacterium]